METEMEEEEDNGKVVDVTNAQLSSLDTVGVVEGTQVRYTACMSRSDAYRGSVVVSIGGRTNSCPALLLLGFRGSTRPLHEGV